MNLTKRNDILKKSMNDNNLNYHGIKKNSFTLLLILAVVCSFLGCKNSDGNNTFNSSENANDSFSSTISSVNLDNGNSDINSDTNSNNSTTNNNSNITNISDYILSDYRLSPALDLSSIPDYLGKPYVAVNNNEPFWNVPTTLSTSFEFYSELDSYGRCGVCIANVGIDIMPTEERSEIGQIKPAGWHTIKYSEVIKDLYLYNRCHLLGYQLTGENANTKNLITGTRYLNVEGMLPFENKVAEYVENTSNHVLYRVTPIYEGNNLLASGVLMEAQSIEDGGKGVCFNVFCYNVQPGVIINYTDGNSELDKKWVAENITTTNETTTLQEAEPNTDVTDIIMVWIPRTGSKYHSNQKCSNMKNPSPLSLKDARLMGYEPCKKCYD